MDGLYDGRKAYHSRGGDHRTGTHSYQLQALGQNVSTAGHRDGCTHLIFRKYGHPRLSDGCCSSIVLVD